VGQHPRMVGQHKSEKWVNMLQNVHVYDINNYITLLEHAITKRNEYSLEKKGNATLSGRILCFETFLTTHDGAAYNWE